MRKTPVSGRFESSPVTALQQHMASMQNCVEQLLAYIDTVPGKNRDEAASRSSAVYPVLFHA